MRFSLMSLRAKGLIAAGVLWLFFYSCNTEKPEALTDSEIAAKWAQMAMYIAHHTPANTPTFASRCYGYIGLTMYESIVAGYPDYNSLAGQLNGLESLPKPEAGQSYHWPSAFNAAQAFIIHQIYIQTSDENKAKVDSLAQAIDKSIFGQVNDKAVVERSQAYGRSVASAIFEWSKTDGGHRGYLKNFDKKMTYPEHPGSWKPPLFAQSFSHYPLHPHWGENRTFLKENSDLPIPYMIPFDTSENSAYYQQFKAVYDKEKTLTQEEKEIAIWWADDPDATFTPPGHSFYIATVAIKTLKPDLIKCAATYAHVGLAISDAYVNCWKWKYHYFSERPNTYITEHIDQRWESFWPDPPFPAFPSGHAIQGAAAATVLIELYGPDFAFTDDSHVGRERDEIRDTDFKARAYKGFWDFARESANSRFYGGIHTPQDNQTGLEQGAVIASNVNSLRWKKDKK